MPYRDPSPEDPSMFVGNVVDCTRNEMLQMAASFAGELAEMGHDTDTILHYFRSPTYAGPHLAWRNLGEEKVREFIVEAVAFWSHFRVVVREPAVGQAPAKTRRSDP